MDNQIKCISCSSTTSHKYYQLEDNAAISQCHDCQKCNKCHVNNSVKLDPFMEIYNDKTKIDISTKLCSDCISQIKCDTCNTVSKEPWHKYKLNLKTNSCICGSCTPIKRLCHSESAFINMCE